MAECILKDARLPDGRIVDIVIDNGLVAHVGASKGYKSDSVFSCHNHLVLPGATDMHVHMRDSEQSAKEDWATGTMAAVAGGVTTVIDQPNSIPPMETREAFRLRSACAREKAYCRYGINGSLTENADIKGVAEEGAVAFGEMFAGPSSYGSALSEETISRVTREATELGKLITVHAEELNSTPVVSLLTHQESRSIAGEVGAIKMVNRLVPSDARLHYCHLSSVAAIEAVRQGATYEVMPHHLFLSFDDEGRSYTDTHAKMNPPLRTKLERRKLFQRFAEIPVIASDHAPHTIEDKYVEFSKAPSGVPGVETMLPLLMHEVYNGMFSLDDIIKKTVTNPNSILGIESPGFETGSRADFAVYTDSPSVIKSENLHSKCGWTPYEGMHGWFPSLTIVKGVPAWNNGEFTRPTPEQINLIENIL